MTNLLAPVEARGVIGRINPLAKLVASLVIGTALLITIDPVSGAVALVCVAALTPWAGVPARALAVRVAPLLIAAPLTALTILLYGAPSGQEYWHFGLISVTDGSIWLALSTLLRVLAIGYPAILMVATVDPTDLADALAQLWKLPARFVLAALAALRLVALMVDDWRWLLAARRSRGVADARGFIGRIRFAAGAAFALLVIAVRRGGALATAMEARGFGSDIPRTWARRSRFGIASWVLVGIGVAIAALSITSAVLAGTWHPILGRDTFG